MIAKSLCAKFTSDRGLLLHITDDTQTLCAGRPDKLKGGNGSQGKKAKPVMLCCTLLVSEGVVETKRFQAGRVFAPYCASTAGLC